MELELDLPGFWNENAECMKRFDTKKPRIPVDFWLDDHFLLEEMNIPSTLRYYEDFKYRMKLHHEINDKVEKVIGKRFFAEDPVEPPVPLRFEVLMGSYWKMTEGGTPWLESTVETIDDVKKLITNARKLDMKKAAFPEDWKEKKAAYERATGKPMKLGGNFSRGPATMATSIIGTTNTCMFIMTDPDLMDEFFKLLAQKLVEYHLALMADTDNNERSGYQFNDDNCYLFSPSLYETFCAPVLAKIFAEFAPRKEHRRHQHSDSAMGHLMGILYELGINQANFGPTIDVLDIRKAMPDTVIFGQIPPFTLRNGTREEIVNWVRRDIDTVGRDGRLVECPAGSVAGGTPLENLKLYMWAVHTYGRFN